jgi:hypothetical protein
VRKIGKGPIHIHDTQGQVNISFDQSLIYATQSQSQNDLKELKEIIARFLPLLQQSALSDEQKGEISSLLNEVSEQKEQGKVDQGKVARLNEKLGKAKHLFRASSIASSFISMITKYLQ